MHATQRAGPHYACRSLFRLATCVHRRLQSLLESRSVRAPASAFTPADAVGRRPRDCSGARATVRRTDMDVGAPKRRTGRQSLWRCFFRRLARLTRRSGQPLAVLVNRQNIQYRKTAGPSFILHWSSVQPLNFPLSSIRASCHSARRLKRRLPYFEKLSPA